LHSYSPASSHALSSTQNHALSAESGSGSSLRRGSEQPTNSFANLPNLVAKARQRTALASKHGKPLKKQQVLCNAPKVSTLRSLRIASCLRNIGGSLTLRLEVLRLLAGNLLLPRKSSLLQQFIEGGLHSRVSS